MRRLQKDDPCKFPGVDASVSAGFNGRVNVRIGSLEKGKDVFNEKIYAPTKSRKRKNKEATGSPDFGPFPSAFELKIGKNAKRKCGKKRTFTIDVFHGKNLVCQGTYKQICYPCKASLGKGGK